MSKFDGEAFGRQVLEAVKGYVQPLKDELAAEKAANAVLRARVEALEGRAAVQGPEGAQGPAGSDGAPGLDGRDGAPGPTGKDGRDGVDGKDGAPGAQGAQGDRGAKGDTGPAGPVGMCGDVGERGPQGEKGLDGKDGRDGQPGVPGAPGRDGKDGLGFDDVHVEHDGARTIIFKLVRGERVKEFAFKVPVVIDQGVWRDGGEYDPGDGVTFRGSYWIAQRNTTAKPDDGNTDWRLAVKKGRDGKDAVRFTGAS